MTKILLNKINIYSWLNLASKLIIPVVFLPLLFKNYSAIESQDWLYYLNLMSLSVFFDLGFISLQNRLYGYLNGKGSYFTNLINNKFNSLLALTALLWFILLEVYLFKAGRGFNISIAVGLIFNYMAIYIQNIIFSNSKIIESKNIESLMNILRLAILLGLIYLDLQFTLLLNFYYLYYVVLFVVYLGSLKKFCPNYSFGFSNPYNLVKKYFKQTSSAWVATGLSTGVFYLSNILLTDKYSNHNWNDYLFTMRIIDMITNIAFVPFYSRIPHFIGLYYKNEKALLLVDLKKYLMISVILFVFLVVIGFNSLDYLLELIQSNTKIIQISNVALFCLSMLFFKLGASFLQISAFGNTVKWHKAILLQFVLILGGYFLLPIKDVEFLFTLPFFLAVLFFLPYCFYLAKKNY